VRSRSRRHRTSSDLAARSQFVELADGDDSLDLFDEVVLGQAEQVHRCLARVQARAGVGDHLDELGDRRDVELVHLVCQVLGHHGGHARHTAQPGGQVQARVAHGRQFEVLVPCPVDGVQAEEREEQIGLDALGACPVGHDQGRIHTFQRTLGHDD
jgi:hypothetical protein